MLFSLVPQVEWAPSTPWWTQPSTSSCISTTASLLPDLDSRSFCGGKNTWLPFSWYDPFPWSRAGGLYRGAVCSPFLTCHPMNPNRSSLSWFHFTLPSITSWTVATTSSPQSSTLSGCTELSSLCSSPTSGSRLTWRVSGCRSRMLKSVRTALLSTPTVNTTRTATVSTTAASKAPLCTRTAAPVWPRWRRPKVTKDNFPCCFFFFYVINEVGKRYGQWFPQWGFPRLVGLFCCSLGTINESRCMKRRWPYCSSLMLPWPPGSISGNAPLPSLPMCLLLPSVDRWLYIFYQTHRYFFVNTFITQQKKKTKEKRKCHAFWWSKILLPCVFKM